MSEAMGPSEAKAFRKGISVYPDLMSHDGPRREGKFKTQGLQSRQRSIEDSMDKVTLKKGRVEGGSNET